MPNIFNISEQNTYKITGAFKDEAGAPVLLGALNTVQMTLYYYNSDLTTSDRYHLATINSRFRQNIKNVNNVSIDANGNFSWIMQVNDNVKLNGAAQEEQHRALITWYWTPSKKNSQEIIFNVREVEYI